MNILKEIKKVLNKFPYTQNRNKNSNFQKQNELLLKIKKFLEDKK